MMNRLKSTLWKVGIIGFMLWMAIAASAGAMAVPFDPSPRLVIMIMLDSFRPDYITMYSLPNLQRLVTEGAWVAESRSVFPAMTTPNQTSFVTGALPIHTGIPNNSRYDRQLDRFLSPLRDNRVPTIAEIMSKSGWHTASVNHFMLQNRGAQRYVQGNMDDVIRLLETDSPQLIVYYNAEPDNAGHKYGPFQPGMREAALAADAEIGRLLSALDRLGLTKQTTLVVASDHGMSPNDGTPITPDLTRLLVSDLRIAGSDQQIRPDTDLIYLASGAVYLYWRNGRKTPEREAALLQKLSTIEGADIYTAADMIKLGADPERLGDIAIVPQEGRALVRGNGGGGHGTPAESHNTMLYWGNGIKPGTIVARASIIDIVPTLLTLAKLDIPATVDGQPLQQIIQRTAWKSKLSVAGDYQVKDVAASDMGLIDVAANAADANTNSVWQAGIDNTGNTPTYITLDYGMDKPIAAVQIVSGPSGDLLGPEECVIDVSSDGLRYTTVFAGRLKPGSNGSIETINLDRPVNARYLRITVKSAYDPDTVQIAEIRAWAGRK